MARPLRNRDPERFWLVTIRTLEARLWITPNGNNRKLIGGIIARYQEIFEVELYAYCVLSNHLHLVVRAPGGNLDEFCENVNREIARRINWRNKREGKFWARRYDAVEVVSEDDLLEAFLYVNTNPSRHGLLRDASEWPGLHSYEHSLKERDRKFKFHHYSAADDKYRTSTHLIKLTVLPQFRVLSYRKRKTLIRSLLSERTNEIAEGRKAEGRGFMEINQLRGMPIGSVPGNVSRTTRPPCYTKCSELRKRYREFLRERRARYDAASFSYRLGSSRFSFPEFTFKPPLHRAPRLIPFNPIKEAGKVVPAVG